uniref:Mediator of RNA polymerase II transcription subunit 29 n=1 Tax=Meleagris gallopavo TaxID=9103 RepID=A0A803YSW3_MELGA
MVTPIKAFRPPPAPPANGAHDGAPPGAADAFAPTQLPTLRPLQPPSPTETSQGSSLAQDFDPVQRFRLLIPQLKESLQTLMKVAAQNLVQNSNIDNGQPPSLVPQCHPGHVVTVGVMVAVSHGQKERRRSLATL